MKHEWKKCEKNLYGAKTTPRIVEVPRQKYIMINGKGNPNDEEFSMKVSALYSLAYAIKMGYKAERKDAQENVVTDFTVYPLEGVWKEKKGTELIKEELEYTIMIRQPDFITEDMVIEAMEKVKKKKPNPFYDSIDFQTMQDGTCVDILHIGSYDDEPASFQCMNEFAKENGCQRSETWHREIYLSNTNRVEKSKLKTILRYVIK